MMVKLLRGFFVVFMFFILAGCSQAGGDAGNMPEAADTPELSEDADITMTPMEGTLTATSLTLVITNNTKQNYYSFDSVYSIERKSGDDWEEINTLTEEFDYGNKRGDIYPEKSATIRLKWELLYGELPPGDYLVKKTIFRTQNGRGVLEFVDLMAEFTID